MKLFFFSFSKKYDLLECNPLAHHSHTGRSKCYSPTYCLCSCCTLLFFLNTLIYPPPPAPPPPPPPLMCTHIQDVITSSFTCKSPIVHLVLHSIQTRKKITRPCLFTVCKHSSSLHSRAYHLCKNLFKSVINNHITKS